MTVPFLSSILLHNSIPHAGPSIMTPRIRCRHEGIDCTADCQRTVAEPPSLVNRRHMPRLLEWLVLPASPFMDSQELIKKASARSRETLSVARLFQHLAGVEQDAICGPGSAQAPIEFCSQERIADDTGQVHICCSLVALCNSRSLSNTASPD